MTMSSAVEDFLQKFETMAPAADWEMSKFGVIRTSGWEHHPHWPQLGVETICPLHFVAGFGFRDTAAAQRTLGLTNFELRELWNALDGNPNASPFLRQRVLAAAGLRERS